MKSLLGLHWIRTHPDGRDYRHIEKMQYPSAKLFEWHWSNRDACRDLLAVLPQKSYILARDHPLSEQKQDMWNDPVGTGTRHANEWANKVASGNVYTPVERTFFLGINEPDATSGDRAAIDRYTTAFLNRLRVHGLRGGAFNFSTGHPRTKDGTGATEADYTVFEQSHQTIVEGSHIGVLHIYGTAAQPLAPGHYDRLKACDWQDVEWIVGECGADEHVIGGGAHDGFLISMRDNPARYCDWLDQFIMGVNDPRIHSYQVFTYDFSHPWSSFDTRPIRDALESYQWQHMAQRPTKPTTQPVETRLPNIVSPTPAQSIGPTAIVSVIAGANIRIGPATYYEMLGAVPFSWPLTITGRNAAGDWWQVKSPFDAHPGFGWVHADLVDALNADSVPMVETEQPLPPEPEPTPPAPMPTGILDPLVLEAIVLTESGGAGFENLRLKIRLEAHLLLGARWGNPPAFSEYFRYDSENILNAYFRRSIGDSWIAYHGAQELEWQAFELARKIDEAAALRCISMGAGQIMGFNAKRVGYGTPKLMFEAFSRGEIPQMMAVVNYCLSDAGLVQAIRDKNWNEIVARYNGEGLEHIYTPRLLKNYRAVGGVA